MNLPCRLLALSLLALAVSGPASAQLLGDKPFSFDTTPGNGAPAGFVEGFFVLDNRLVGESSNARYRLAETGNLRGGGAAGRFDVLPWLFLTGEYRRTPFNRIEFDDLNTLASAGARLGSDLTTIRGGAGVGAAVSGVPVYVRGEYSGLKLSGNVYGVYPNGRQNGYGALVGLNPSLNRVLGVEGEVGFTDNRDFGRGFEFRVGGWLNVLPNLALTLHYRRTALNNGSFAGHSYLETGGAGLRFQFGGYGLPAPAPGASQP